MSWIQGLRPCEALGPACIVDWGTVVAAVVGLVTVLVAVLAWLTSKRAAEIAEEATKIARGQHEESKGARMANARITGRLLLHEINNFPARCAEMRRRLAAVAVGDTHTRPSGKDVLSIALTLSETMLPNAERVEDRIHNLPIQLGADLATLISHTRDISAEARRIRAQVIVETGFRQATHYVGDTSDLVKLLSYISFVHDLAVSFRVEFRAFVLSDGAGEIPDAVAPGHPLSREAADGS